jgi:hypothetical protein
VQGVIDLLLETATWEVQGVGGERGVKTIWLEVSFHPGVTAERCVIEGETIVADTIVRDGEKFLTGALRLEEVDGKVSRLLVYGFCPETLALVAAETGLPLRATGYRQDAATIVRMIAGAGLPWTPS